MYSRKEALGISDTGYFYGPDASPSSNQQCQSNNSNSKHWPNHGPAHVAEWSSTQVPYAAERDVLTSRGSNSSLAVSTYQRIISNDSHAHDKQRDNPGLEKKRVQQCPL